MPRGPRLVLDNAIYHIITRGNQRQRVFWDQFDYTKYLKKLKFYKKGLGFKLYGYCLMPNHIHIIGQMERKENLAIFMQSINNSYTFYFNFKYKKVGHLWQGRFKSKIITKNRYLLDCISYVELNPVRANIVISPCEYKWSSYKERNLGVDRPHEMLDNLSL